MAVIVVSVTAGVILGVALTQLADNDDSAGTLTEGRGKTPASTTSRTEPGQQMAPARHGAADARKQLRLRIISAVLHPAATPSGQRRRRGRLSVHVRVKNHGSQRVVPARPSLLAARQRTRTNPRADGPATRLGPIGAGQTVDVTLRFETAGAVTEQLTTQRRGRILVGGRSWPISVRVGSPASSSTRSGAATQRLRAAEAPRPAAG